MVAARWPPRLEVGSQAEPLARHVWTVDLTISVPATLLGGVLLWRRAALGYVVAAGLLFAFGLTPIALAAILAVQPWLTGTAIDGGTIVGLLVFAATAYVPLGFFVRGARADTQPAPARWRLEQPVPDQVVRLLRCAVPVTVRVSQMARRRQGEGMQRNQHSTAQADAVWGMLYRIGGISAGLFVALLVVATALAVTTPAAPTAGGAAILEYIASNRTLTSSSSSCGWCRVCSPPSSILRSTPP